MCAIVCADVSENQEVRGYVCNQQTSCVCVCVIDKHHQCTYNSQKNQEVRGYVCNRRTSCVCRCNRQISSVYI